MNTMEEDIRGFEFDWLATDAQGFVALFSTAGGGYAPATFLRDTRAHDDAIEGILALPAGTNATCKLHLGPSDTNTWKRMAERGIFAFDSDVFGGPYRLIAAPEVPIRADDLPAEMAEVARRITYPRLSFRDASELTEAQLLH